MKHNNIMGVIFANVHDDLMPEFTEVRSTASIPFGGKYRLIDFSLSNLKNAGISKVGVIPKYNYHSLMDHLGSGKPWDLDRKSGGLSILPPYITSQVSIYTGHIDSLHTIASYLKWSKEKYIVMCDADVVGNIDIENMFEKHSKSGADITIAYKKGPLPKSNSDIMCLELSENQQIKKIRMSNNFGMECLFSLDVVVMEREMLINLISEAREENLSRLWRDVFAAKVNSLKMFGYEVSGVAWVIDSIESYANANFELLNPKVYSELLNSQKPIYTKNRDDVPTKYGLNAKVENSLVADGCFIEGSVTDCVIFRGVHIEKGAMLSNCIVMQDSVIEKNSELKYVITDKNAHITQGRMLCGAPTHYMTVRKSAKV